MKRYLIYNKNKKKKTKRIHINIKIIIKNIDALGAEMLFNDKDHIVKLKPEIGSSSYLIFFFLLILSRIIT